MSQRFFSPEDQNQAADKPAAFILPHDVVTFEKKSGADDKTKND